MCIDDIFVRATLNERRQQRLRGWPARILWAILATLFFSACGCMAPPRRPVWMADSSGFVVNDQLLYFDIASKKSVELKSPLEGMDRGPLSWDIHPKSKLIVHAEIRPVPDDKRTFLVTLCTSGWNTPPGQPFELPMTLQNAPDFGGFAVHLSPDGRHLLVCYCFHAAVVDLEKRKLVVLPDVTPPMLVESVLGLDPCRPDGAGFLALQRRPDWPGLEGSSTEEVLGGFLKGHSNLVFVKWDGSVAVIEGLDALRQNTIEIIAHSYVKREQGLGSLHRFLGQAKWWGNTAVLSFGATLEIDTEAGVMRHVPPGAAATADGMNGLLSTSQTVELGDGKRQLQIRVQDPGAKPMEQGFPILEAVVLDRDLKSERVIDSGGREDRFALWPSPDGKFVLLSRWDFQFSRGYSVLLDQHGEYVASFGIEEKEWKWENINKQVRLPVATNHHLFGPGLSIDKTNCSDKSMELMAKGSGDFANLRETRFLAVEANAYKTAMTAIGRQHLGSLPHVRFLAIGGGDAESAALLGAFPQVEGVSAAFTDAILEQMPRMEKVRVIDMKNPQSARIFEKSEPKEAPRLTGAGIQNLAKFPQLKELHLDMTGGLTDEGFKQLADAQWEDFSHLSGLNFLDIWSRKRNVGLKNLNKLQKLSKLHLSSSIDQETINRIGMAGSLYALRIQGTASGPIQLGPLASLKSLRHLDFSVHESIGVYPVVKNQPLPDTAAHPLSELTALEHLKLYHLKVTEADLTAFRSLRKLKWAHLGKADCSDAALKQFSASIPAAFIMVYIENGQHTARYKGGVRLPGR